MFTIHIEDKAGDIYDDLVEKAFAGTLTKAEKDLYKKLSKILHLLSENPRHPGLNSHEIDVLSARLKVKVWQSYLENKRSGARRIFWYYGPGKQQITILAIEKHPEPGPKGYAQVSLSHVEKPDKK